MSPDEYVSLCYSASILSIIPQFALHLDTKNGIPSTLILGLPYSVESAVLYGAFDAVSNSFETTVQALTKWNTMAQTYCMAAIVSLDKAEYNPDSQELFVPLRKVAVDLLKLCVLIHPDDAVHHYNQEQARATMEGRCRNATVVIDECFDKFGGLFQNRFDDIYEMLGES